MPFSFTVIGEISSKKIFLLCICRFRESYEMKTGILEKSIGVKSIPSKY